MIKRILAVGAGAICLFSVVVLGGCGQNDNGPSTIHNSANDFKKNAAATPAQRAAVLNNPNVPARAKAFFLGQVGSQGSSLPPQIAAHKAATKK